MINKDSKELQLVLLPIVLHESFCKQQISLVNCFFPCKKSTTRNLIAKRKLQNLVMGREIWFPSRLPLSPITWWPPLSAFCFLLSLPARNMKAYIVTWKINKIRILRNHWLKIKEKEIFDVWFSWVWKINSSSALKDSISINLQII